MWGLNPHIPPVLHLPSTTCSAAYTYYGDRTALFRPSEFRDLVSGRRQGLAAAALRFGLSLAEIPYALAVRRRNRRYDSGLTKVHRVPASVISVGNMTLGGTGKTPLVEWIARRLSEQGLRVGIVSRGYRAAPRGYPAAQNDEARELKRRLPAVPHVQNPDRVAGAREAIARFACEALVLDDAFQHRRIARDLDICLLDALEPFGHGHVFPRGTLRESLAGLRRADVVCLSRADLVPPGRRQAIRRAAARYAPHAAWAEFIHAPQELASARGNHERAASLAGMPVAAFCGIGNPAGFRGTLADLGYRVIAMREFADHYRYTQADTDSLIAWANGLEIAAVVCTSKDLAKLDIDRLGNRPLWAVTIAVNFLVGQELFESKLAEAVGV
jgi:tetraacyldisaccharide 4'-kinase